MSNLITPVAILSYPHLFQAQPPLQEGGKPKFGCSLVFPEGTDVTAMKQAAVEAAKEKFGDKAVKMIRDGKLKFPFRTDGEEKGYPEGSVFVNVRSERRPGIVSRYADPATGKARVIEDEDEIYPGVQVKALVHAYGYDTAGNRGVTFALDGIQKWDDGDRLDGRVKAEDAFDAEELAVADLSDLTDEGGGDEAPAKKSKKGKGKKGKAPADDDGDDLDLDDLI